MKLNIQKTMKLFALTFVLVLLISQKSCEKLKRIELRNGQKMPIVGFGTSRMLNQVAYNATLDAIDVGYRHIDTATIYGNEKDIGRAINKRIADGKIKRADIFVVTKVFDQFSGRQRALSSVQNSLRNMNLSYIDLVLVHWPYKNWQDTYKGLEDAVDKKYVKSIGVSNFNIQQVNEVLNFSRIKPVNNQVECHPYLAQNELIQHNHKNQVRVTAHRPLGGKAGSEDLLKDPKIVKLVNKYNRTAAQILIRWQVDRDVIVIPKSSQKTRIMENINIDDFKLSAEDVKYLNDLKK